MFVYKIPAGHPDYQGAGIGVATIRDGEVDRLVYAETMSEPAGLEFQERIEFALKEFFRALVSAGERLAATSDEQAAVGVIGSYEICHLEGGKEWRAVILDHLSELTGLEREEVDSVLSDSELMNELE